ncbi:MAG: hypothetical protein JO304_16170 [Solirubrobacterales bacterium]|nr:hypothetical protein [Solirubrobacterales bacterium]
MGIIPQLPDPELEAGVVADAVAAAVVVADVFADALALVEVELVLPQAARTTLSAAKARSQAPRQRRRAGA